MKILESFIIATSFLFVSCQLLGNSDLEALLENPEVMEESQGTLTQEQSMKLLQGEAVEIALSGEGEKEIHASVMLEGDVLVVVEKEIKTVFENTSENGSTEGNWIAVKQIAGDVTKELVKDDNNAIMVHITPGEGDGVLIVHYEVLGDPKFVVKDIPDKLVQTLNTLAEKENMEMSKREYMKEEGSIVISGEVHSVLSEIQVLGRVATMVLTEGDDVSELKMELYEGPGVTFEGNIWTGVIEESVYYAYFDGHGHFYLVETIVVIDVVEKE